MTNIPAAKTVLSQSLYPYLQLNNQGQELTISLQQTTCYFGRDERWANIEPPIPQNWSVISGRHAILQQDGEDYRIFDGDGQKHSTNGLWQQRKRIGMTGEGLLLQDGMQVEIGQDPGNCIRLTYVNPRCQHSRTPPSKRRLVLGGLSLWPVVLGREAGNGAYNVLQLDAPTVSRRHATISQDFAIADCSSNGTFINGKRLAKPTRLQDGDKIQIGPFTLTFGDGVLEIFDPGDRLRLDAHGLLRIVRNPRQGEKILLNNISLPIEPGQLVGIVGGSGTGKSTLLKTLLGILPLERGAVLLNGDDLRQHFPIYRSQIGYVPQDDIVHADLTVEEVLSYACQLRLPPETPAAAVVEQTLQQVKLDFVRGSFVRELSGGQRKRVSIGVELLADPKLLCLDEPTSGLDPGLELEVMELLRELAERGRTVVLVTHATANIDKCDRLAFLGRGGSLCYFGPPREALDFFDLPNFASIYCQLETGKTPTAVAKTVRDWHDRFRQSSFYQTYIEGALSSPPSHLTSPLVPAQPFDLRRSALSCYRQWLVLARRYLCLVRRDRASLLLSLLTAPLVAILLALLDETSFARLEPPVGTQAPAALKVLFTFTCAAIFVGLLGSVTEIVKEAGIYARERLVNLGIFPYLGSKLLVRGGLALLQTFLIVLAVFLGFSAPDTSPVPWILGLAVTTFLTIFASLCLGLMVSAGARQETAANNSLSLILLPQIVLSGVLFKLQGWGAKLSWLTLSRWSVGAYGSLADVNGMIPPPEVRQTPLGSVELPRLADPNPAYAATWHNLSLNWAILLLHAILYLAITFWLQKRKDILGKDS